MDRSLQETYAPANACFGCGPANPKGLRVRSFVEEGGAGTVCRFTPSPHHEAFPGMLSGGILGTLLDCHMNWTAAWHLMNRAGADSPPCTVTAEYTVTLLAPTPSTSPVTVRAWVVDATDRRATVEGVVESDGVVTVRGRGTFVAVKEGHPAWHRW